MVAAGKQPSGWCVGLLLLVHTVTDAGWGQTLRIVVLAMAIAVLFAGFVLLPLAALTVLVGPAAAGGAVGLAAAAGTAQRLIRQRGSN